MNAKQGFIKAKLDKKYNEEHDKYLSDFENWDERD